MPAGRRPRASRPPPTPLTPQPARPHTGKRRGKSRVLKKRPLPPSRERRTAPSVPSRPLESGTRAARFRPCPPGAPRPGSRCDRASAARQNRPRRAAPRPAVIPRGHRPAVTAPTPFHRSGPAHARPCPSALRTVLRPSPPPRDAAPLAPAPCPCHARQPPRPPPSRLSRHRAAAAPPSAAGAGTRCGAGTEQREKAGSGRPAAPAARASRLLGPGTCFFPSWRKAPARYSQNLLISIPSFFYSCIC